MESKRLHEGEARFMDIVWSSEPVPSGELVALCQKALGWKKSTTYTTIKRLCDKGLLRSEDSVVTALVSREEVQAAESSFVVEQTFAGSLPGFLVAFLGGKTMSKEEAEELKRMIDAHCE